MDFIQEFYLSKFGIVGHMGEFFTVDEGENCILQESVFAQNKFYYIKEGNCTFCINGEIYEGIPDRIFLIPAGIPHSFSNDSTKNFSAFRIYFDIYPNNIGIFNLFGLPPYVDAKGSYFLMQFYFDDYIEYQNYGRVADMIHIKSCLIELILQYMALAERDGFSVQNSKNKVFNSIIEYIDENIDKNFTNDELAREFHFHPNHLIRVFKKKTGQTPARYIKMRKMETAKQLIEETELNFNEIMHRVGSDDSAHFSKMFKSIYGLSPRSYRQDIRNLYKFNDFNLKHSE